MKIYLKKNFLYLNTKEYNQNIIIQFNLFRTSYRIITKIKFMLINIHLMFCQDLRIRNHKNKF